jgi:hypothetical protein
MFVPVERVTQPPNPPQVPYRGIITLSGIALTEFQGSGEDWRRAKFILDLEEDYNKALSQVPYQPSQGHSFTFSIKRKSVFATVNARYSDHMIDGSAVDSFGLNDEGVCQIFVDLGTRDAHGELIRIGYQVELYGDLLER